MSDGNSRHRADFFVPNGHPKRLWLREMEPDARQKAIAVPLGLGHAGALVAPVHGVMPPGPEPTDEPAGAAAPRA